MSKLNRSNQLTSVDVNDQIELNIQTSKSTQENDEQSKERLIKKPEIKNENQQDERSDQMIRRSKKRKSIVEPDKSNRLDSWLIRMNKLKSFFYLIVLLISILITYQLARRSNDSIDSIESNRNFSCSKANDLPIEESIKNITQAYYRLPNHLVPINYKVLIRPFMNPDDLYFRGNVLITVRCLNSTNIIQLNSNELEFNEQIRINEQTNNRTIKINNLTLDNEVLTIHLDRFLEQNSNLTIFISFKGNLTTSLSGFYRSSYMEPQTGETRYLVMTQFQATDARRAFPCFDEPQFKSTFDIEIIHWKNMTAISNMQTVSSEPFYSDNQIGYSDWVITKFKRTVKMSTYLVAFTVGDFSFKETIDEGIKYRIVTRPSELNDAQEAINYSPWILKHFEKYFHIKFPLEKLDMLAACDFSAGGMENWGLIIYREAYLLYNKRIGSVVQLYRIISVIAHEIAHQWFGNLVTPIYWRDLWLNEGFATYMSYEGVNAVRPEWKIWDRFVLDEIHDVLGYDALKNSHPVSVEVNDPNEISELFDHISYSKSASIIRMMTYIIGISAFREGLTNYLNAFKFSNADQSDLWSYLQEANDRINDNQTIERVNIENCMNSWTLTEGYPLIIIKRDYRTNDVRFTQKRFLLNSNESDNESLFKIQYEVPITYTTKSEQNWNPTIRFWLHRTNQMISYVIKQIDISKDDWLICNLQQIGYYRVTYDDRNWQLIVDQLLTDHTVFHRINRAQILDDLFDLAENNVVTYSLALKALTYFKNEQDPFPWSNIASYTFLINRMLRRTAIFGDWKKFLLNLIEPAYRKFELNEIENENLQNSQMQRTIVGIACAYNLKSCVESSKKLFNDFMDQINRNQTTNQIPPNIRANVYCTAIHHGDEMEWNFLYKLYLKEQNANERNVILSALTCSRIPWILVRYLMMVFDESSGIKTQDGVFVFKGIANQNFAKEIAFNFLRENYDQIFSIYGRQMSFAHIIKSLDSINSAFELKLVKDFFHTVTQSNKVGSAKRAFLQTLDQIESNIRWMNSYESEIGEFLRKNSQ